MDSQGNELWRRATPTQDTLCYRPFAFITQNDDYLITWSDPILDNSFNDNSTIWLARMTDNGIISGKRRINEDIEGFPTLKDYYVNDYYQDDSGNIFLMGEMTYRITSYNVCYTKLLRYLIASEYNYIQYNQYPLLIFANLNGDTVSTKRYTFLPTDDIGRRVKPYQILKLPDGGYILSCEDRNNFV